MHFRLDEAVDVLQRTPAVLGAWLEDVREPWYRNNYGPETFSPFDVVGHLIHGERTDWIPRARIILEHGCARPFEPFDRYAMYEASKGTTMADLLDTFARLRAGSLRTLHSFHLTEAQLQREGTHPALGRVTLGQLLATWVTHDLNHIHQIAKSMAFQYRDQVGPWVEYISILPR